jgi:four helix bundle protein
MTDGEGRQAGGSDGAGRVKRDIEDRTFHFAVRVLRLVAALPNDRVADVVGRQLGRCGASVGANVEEAQGSHSRAEFVRRMNIARSEAREALYWLRLLAESGYVKRERLRDIIAEADALVRILVTIVKRSRDGS